MSYSLNFTDRIANSEGIIVNDNTINTSTSLGFPGRNQKGYAVTIAENFLHLLENFAKTTPPDNPIEGQLWYNTSPGVDTLMVYDGTAWKSSGALKKGTSEPSNNTSGDLWVDTDNQQLYLYNGSEWKLVGPTFSSGLKTGAIADKIVDSSKEQTEHVVLINYVDDTVVSIVSTTAFTPQSGITGFETIKAGINLSSVATKFWGTSEKAENLVIGGISVPAVNFLRSDVANITNQNFSIRNNSGLNLGSESQLQVRISDQRGVIYHATPATKLDLRVNVGSVSHEETTLISLDATTGNVGVGSNNFTPTETLSVKGTGSFTGILKVTDTTETQNTATGSLIIDGGAVIKKKLRVSGEIIASDKINSLSIVPVTDNTSNLGSSSLRYSTVYASNFSSGSLSIRATFTGDLTGNVTGNITGSATSLLSSTTFKMAGDVSDTTGFSFNGTTGGTTKTFNTTISPTFISNKTAITSILDTDELLLYRPYAPGNEIPGLYKTTKTTLVSNLPFVPVGAIFPFAGSIVPNGYLLCDGSEKQIGVYQELYKTIGLTYTPNTASLIGSNTFKIPDLRGRFPLGLDNMDNGDKVPDKTSPNVVSLIDSGGGPAGRVNASTASTLGNAAGYEQVSLDLSKIPQHKHNLVGSNGGQYYVTNTKTEAPTDENSTQGNSAVSTVKGQSLSTTGNIDTNISLGQPVSIMNPYLAINYIIYSGVFS
jgi:hypothetical protein